MVVFVKHEHPLEEEHTMKRIVITLGIAILALTAATAAFAGSMATTATVTGTAGISLTHSATATVTNTIDGTDQIASYAPALAVIDARGLGTGWNLTISATAFTDGASHTLAQPTIASVASACHAGSTCTAATNAIAYPLTVGTVAAKFFNATANSGLGKIDVTPTINIAVPGNAYAGTYTSTVTLASVAGP
jgi:hypothetical protein